MTTMNVREPLKASPQYGCPTRSQYLAACVAACAMPKEQRQALQEKQDQIRSRRAK